MRSLFPLPCYTEARAWVSPVSSTWHREPGTPEISDQWWLDLGANVTASWKVGELGSPLTFQEALRDRCPLLRHSPIGQDALRDFTHQDEEQHEGQDPTQVVPREVEPRAMVDVYFGALTAPSCKQRQEEVGSPAWQEGGACTLGGCSGTGPSVGRVSICTPVHENARVWYTRPKCPSTKPGSTQAHLRTYSLSVLTSHMTNRHAPEPFV